MTREEREANEVKEVIFCGSPLEDLRAFPAEVRREIGFTLDRMQRGLTHQQNAKPLRGFSGVFEIKSDYDRNTYRTVYAVKRREIYVLHCFQKKSTRGIKTPRKEIDLIKRRLQIAQELAKEG